MPNLGWWVQMSVSLQRHDNTHPDNNLSMEIHECVICMMHECCLQRHDNTHPDMNLLRYMSVPYI